MMYPVSIVISSNMLRCMKTFAELLTEHIDRRYGGNAAEFARTTGFKPQTVSAWKNGRVGEPQLATRRQLAKELGISPIELLISMGIIDRSEVDHPIESDPLIVSELRAILEGREFTDKQVRQLATMVRGMVEMMEG